MGQCTCPFVPFTKKGGIIDESFKTACTFWMGASLILFVPCCYFASLAITQVIPLPFLPRYDWLLIICLLMQWVMVRSGLETRDELKVITLFHLIGLALEIFKTHMGSWSYPEEGFSKFLECLCIVDSCTQV